MYDGYGKNFIHIFVCTNAENLYVYFCLFILNLFWFWSFFNNFLFFIHFKNSANASRPSTPVQSDTEFEFSQRKAENEEVGQSWAWGQLPSTAQNEGLGKEDSQGTTCFLFLN